ncbi:MAG: PucR family transcriptional regulator [Tissierella sp.]|uniref:PucR family transcriptional regulator n=1 Tax=Tissierella sp. TaxID=41274 RepID=UPI003F991099
MFTIKDFLNLNIINGAIVKTDIETIDERNIEAISVTELPVENFVHKNELVLTTAIGCKEDHLVFKNFVRDIYNSGATALVISTGKYVDEIPQSIIDYANSLKFPIIDIPWKVRFGTIIETVLLEINRLKHSNARVFETLQKKLLTLFLSGSTLSEAAQLIYKELGNQAVIVNTSGTIKGRSEGSDNLLETLEAPLKVLSSRKNLSLLSGFDCKEIYTVNKISSKNMLYGYLYLEALGDKDGFDYAKDNKKYITRHIISPISLWFDREQTIFETEMHHKDSFVWDLVTADEDKIDELVTKSKTIGYNLSLSYIGIVGLISNLENSYDLQRSNFTSYEEWKFNCIKNLKTEVLRAAQNMEQEVMVTYQEERLIIFLEVRGDDIEKSSNSFLDTIEDRIKLIYPRLTLSWGISENKIENKSFNKVFSDAKISLEINRDTKKAGFRNIYKNPSIYRLLSILSNDKEANTICLNVIGGLIEYDSKNNLNLLNTFKAYVQNKGNVSQTSRLLHLHRQSLLYRLKRIEEITHLSLEEADDTFLLEICIRLWDTQNNFFK